MASLAITAGVQTTGLTFGAGFGVGLIGFALVGAAGYIDNRYVMPNLLGNKGDARTRKLLDIPAMTTAPGTPRIWCMGRRGRIPLHVMFQSDKVRESSAGGSKGGVANQIKRVFSDIAFAVNDRRTERITQLIGTGKLLWWSDRNLVCVSTSAMALSDSSGSLLVEMDTNDEPDFFDYFAVDDVVILDGFAANGGPAVNGRWKVTAVTKHGASPSTITLSIYAGQSLTSLAATAGTENNPARICRVDDAVVDHTITAVPDSLGAGIILTVSTATMERFQQVFTVGDSVRLVGWVTNPGGVAVSNSVELGVNSFNTLAGTVILVYRGGGTYGNIKAGTATNAGSVEFWSQTFVPGMFAADPSLSFHQGTEDQTEDDIIARHEATGTIPGFRGLAYQVVDQFDLATYFGNQIPLMEAIVEPDPSMTWRDAFLTLGDRYGFAAEEMDVSGVRPRPFAFYYVLGSVIGVTAFQPLLLASQVATQERDGVLAFFQIENADIVQIENGATFSDLGTRAGRDTPNAGDKIRHMQADEGDLPTLVGVKHQDVDNVYAGGYQPFGLRQPTGDGHANEQEVDLSQLALTRKEARNIAGTIMRRTWVNAQSVELQLPVAYIEVLENDLLTVTDDDGNDLTVRVIRREVGANFVVNIVAVREHLALSVTGSPVQGAGTPPPPIVQAPIPVVSILDVPPLDDADTEPGVYVAACSPRGGHWSGASVHISTDGGASYTQVGTLSGEVGCGVTTATLGGVTTFGEDAAGTLTWDDANTLSVHLDNDGPFPPLTVTEADVIAGVNWCIVQDGTEFEVIGFRDVTDNGDGSYDLDHLLRGLRGSFAGAEAGAASGSTVTMLTAARGSMAFVPIGPDVPRSVSIKVVPTGLTLADVEATALTAEGWNARPMPVRDFDNVNDGGTNDRTFTLRHWTRQNLPAGSTGPFPLDETAEGYRLRIYDPTGATLMRVKHRDAVGTGSPTLASAEFVYTAAEQTTDGYTPGATETFWVELAQLGDYGIDSASGAAQRRDGRVYRQEI